MTVSSLACEQTYSIVVGAIITNIGTMEQTLSGPRLQAGIFTASSCPTTSSSSTEIGK